MKNNRGFTLVELLAVIVIMGILMMVAIPSVTRTIENSRKDTFVDIAKSYGNAARTLWTSDNLTCNGVVSSAVDDGDYYILINSKSGAKESLPVLVDQGGKSSWGNRDVNGYVRVNVSTTPGVDSDNDGTYEVEPRRVTKFYVALSDGTHGLVDDNTLMMDELKRGNVVMTLSSEQLKKVELTVDDGRLDCARDANGRYSCTNVTPIKDMTGVCVDDQTNVGVTGNVENVGVVNYGERYILTYKHSELDPSTTVPDEMIFFADKSAKFVTAGVIQNLPAGSVQMEGNRILTGDDSELVYVSNDKKSITFTDGYTNTLLIRWDLALDYFPIETNLLELSQNAMVNSEDPDERYAIISTAVPHINLFENTVLSYKDNDNNVEMTLNYIKKDVIAGGYNVWYGESSPQIPVFVFTTPGLYNGINASVGVYFSWVNVGPLGDVDISIKLR